MRKLILVLLPFFFTGVQAHACFMGFIGDCSAKSDNATPAAPPEDPNLIQVNVLYGSEKDGDHGTFLPALGKKFEDQINAQGGMTLDGTGKKYRVKLNLKAEGSEAALTRIMKGEPIALFAPASNLQINSGNFKKMTAEGSAPGAEPLFKDVKEVYRSPVVIAMLDYMVAALKLKSPNPGWKDIFALSQNGWAAYGQPSFGRFRWGHTHPNYSNSGRMSVLAEAYAAILQNNPNIDPDMVWSDANIQDARVGQFINSVEQSIQFYGKSTGFYTQAMGMTGANYQKTATGQDIKPLVQLQAAVTYESDLQELNKNLASHDAVGCKAGTGNDPQTCQLVPIRYQAIYPAEGVMWATHPFAIVNSPSVSEPQKAVAQAFRSFLLQKENQDFAVTSFGMRPVNVDSLGGISQWNAKLIKPELDFKKALPLPEVDGDLKVADLWVAHKRKASVVLVMDDSGSMQEDAYRDRPYVSKISEARKAAKTFIEKMSTENNLNIAMTSFHDEIPPGLRLAPLTVADAAPFQKFAKDLDAGGGTPLFAHILKAARSLLSQCKNNENLGILVMTDGEDDQIGQIPDPFYPGSPMNAIRLNVDSETGCNVRVFTIGLGLFRDRNGQYPQGDGWLRSFGRNTGSLHYTAEDIEKKGLAGVFEEIGFFF